VSHILFHRYSVWISGLNYLLDYNSEFCLISGRKLYVVLRLLCAYRILQMLVPITVYISERVEQIYNFFISNELAPYTTLISLN